MSTAVYPGSFDPITVGHIDIIKRIHAIYDQVIVLVADSVNKNHLFTAEERKALAVEALGDLAKDIEVDIFDGLTVDYLRSRKANVIVRGLRAVTDFEYEMSMASMNQKIAPDIETMLVFARPEFYYVSSRGVKEVAKYRGDLTGLVPDNVAPKLLERLQQG